MIGGILGATIPTILAIVGGAYHIGGRLGSLEEEVKDNSEKISNLQTKIDSNFSYEEQE